MDTKAQSSGAMGAALGLIAAGAVIVLYVLFAAASKPESHEGLARFAVGDMRAKLQVLDDPPPLPTRPLRDAAGREVRLAAEDGQLLVVNLWATWCAPCMDEMPTLAALQRRFSGRIRVALVNVDGEGRLQAAQTELARLSDGELPFVSDMSRGILFDMRAGGMPTTVIYDRRGREIARVAGAVDWSSARAAALIEAALAA